jgi:hypothetical protein
MFIIYERLKGRESFFHPYFDSVSQPELTYFWDLKTLDTLLNTEFKTKLLAEKAKVAEEFETFSKIVEVYPQHFPDPAKFTFDIFKWALSFLSQRCFGWGIGTTALVPLADMLNNTIPEKSTFGLFQKQLHLEENNAYLYETRFDQTFGAPDPKLSLEEKIYHVETSKAKYNISKLFENDPEVKSNPAL